MKEFSWSLPGTDSVITRGKCILVHLKNDLSCAQILLKCNAKLTGTRGENDGLIGWSIGTVLEGKLLQQVSPFSWWRTGSG